MGFEVLKVVMAEKVIAIRLLPEDRALRLIRAESHDHYHLVTGECPIRD
jgi:hypothetical protein